MYIFELHLEVVMCIYIYIYISVIQVEKQKMPLDSSLCHPYLIVNSNKNKYNTKK